MTDPLTVPCPACRAPAGVKCRNYKGQNKQTCPARGKPALPSAEEKAEARKSVQGDLFGGQA